MLISVLMDKKDDFGKLAAYYYAHQNNQGFMVARQVNTGNNVMRDDLHQGLGAATDAELDVALSFLLAGDPEL